MILDSEMSLNLQILENFQIFKTSEFFIFPLKSLILTPFLLQFQFHFKYYNLVKFENGA